MISSRKISTFKKAGTIKCQFLVSDVYGSLDLLLTVKFSMKGLIVSTRISPKLNWIQTKVFCPTGTIVADIDG